MKQLSPIIFFLIAGTLAFSARELAGQNSHYSWKIDTVSLHGDSVVLFVEEFANSNLCSSYNASFNGHEIKEKSHGFLWLSKSRWRYYYIDHKWNVVDHGCEELNRRGVDFSFIMKKME